MLFGGALDKHVVVHVGGYVLCHAFCAIFDAWWVCMSCTPFATPFVAFFDVLYHFTTFLYHFTTLLYHLSRLLYHLGFFPSSDLQPSDLYPQIVFPRC